MENTSAQAKQEAGQEKDPLQNRTNEVNAVKEIGGQKAELNEEAKLQAEKDAEKADELLKKIKGESVEDNVEKEEIATWEETEKATDELSKMINENEGIAEFGNKRAEIAAEILQKAGYEGIGQLREKIRQLENEVAEAEKNNDEKLPELGKQRATLDKLFSYVGMTNLYADRFGNDINKF